MAGKISDNYKGSVVIVSHDKFFLDRMVNKIVELYQQELHIYTGNYTYYEQEKALRIEMQKRHTKTSRIISGSRKDLLNGLKPKPQKRRRHRVCRNCSIKLERIEDMQISKGPTCGSISVWKSTREEYLTLKTCIEIVW